MILTLMAMNAASAALPTPPCPIDHAVYRLHGAPGFSGGFARQDRRKLQASDLAFWLRTPTRTYWFSFRAPNGYGGTYIAPDIDPRRAARMDDETEREAAQRIAAAEMPDIPFDVFGPDLSTPPGPPQASDPAPALLFVRGLGPALWYDWTRSAAGAEDAVQESMPIGLFEPVGCEGPPAESPVRP